MMRSCPGRQRPIILFPAGVSIRVAGSSIPLVDVQRKTANRLAGGDRQACRRPASPPPRLVGPGMDGALALAAAGVAAAVVLNPWWAPSDHCGAIRLRGGNPPTKIGLASRRYLASFSCCQIVRGGDGRYVAGTLRYLVWCSVRFSGSQSARTRMVSIEQRRGPSPPIPEALPSGWRMACAGPTDECEIAPAGTVAARNGVVVAGVSWTLEPAEVGVPLSPSRWCGAGRLDPPG